MANARQHIANNHRAEQSHWNDFAKGLGELGTHLHAMHKESGMKGESKAGDACDYLKAKAQSHADYHGEQVEACMKAMDADELSKNRLIPDNVSSVIPERFGSFAVPRYGAPAAPARPDVPLEFAKLVEVE